MTSFVHLDVAAAAAAAGGGALLDVLRAAVSQLTDAMASEDVDARQLLLQCFCHCAVWEDAAD